MKIFIDADGCPVTRLCEEIAKKHSIPCAIVCDSAHVFSSDYSEIIQTSVGENFADLALANLIKSGDIAVTQDYGLATLCLSKGGRVLNQNGLEYTNENIDTLLFMRHINRKARMGGAHIKGPKKREKSQDEAFALALTKMIGELK